MTQACPIYAVLLAAGASTRFGADDKLLANVGGKPLVTLSAERVLASKVDGMIAVVRPGAEGEAVATALRHLPISIVVNDAAANGMGSSIARGVSAVPDSAAGIMIAPADMPSLDLVLMQSLIEAFRSHHGKQIVVPTTAAGKQRNPVIWPARLRGELEKLNAQGGKSLLAAHRDHIVTISAPDDGAFEDIDTQDDLARVRASRV